MNGKTISILLFAIAFGVWVEFLVPARDACIVTRDSWVHFAIRVR
jgi:hypothetical protein